MIEAQWGAATHSGRIRQRNEDAVLAGPTTFAVADGMGGHAGGEVASAIAVAWLATLHDPLGSAERLVQALEQANQAIIQRTRTDAALEGMGTTVAGIVLSADDTVTVFNLGDARVYRNRDGELIQLSQDHSLVAEMVRAGTLDEGLAASHPQRHVVTRALGIDDTVDPHLVFDEPRTGDRYLVCSDGLFNELRRDELCGVLGRSTSSAEADAQELLDLALEKGARDNVSVVIIDVEGITSPTDGLEDDTNPTVAETVPTALITQVPPSSEPRGGQA